MTRLTARSVEAARPRGGKRIEIADHVVRGLSLRVSAAGRKTWAVRYRNKMRRQQRVTLGGYPALSLERARAAALAVLAAAAEGLDPARQRQSQRRAVRAAQSATPVTLRDLWNSFDRDRVPNMRPTTAAYHRWLWRKHLEPRLGARRLEDLDRLVIKSALRDIGKTAPVQANRALALLKCMLNVAVDEGALSASPVDRVGRLYSERSRDRVLNDAELQRLLLFLEVVPKFTRLHVSRSMCLAIKLVPMTGARAGEIAGIQAEEIDHASRTWIIPSARFKSGRPHAVPLSNQAWAVLVEVFGADAADWHGPAFPNARNASLPMRRMSVTRAMQRIAAAANIPRATLHDLRRTVATYMAGERIGVPPHIIGAVLGHAAEGSAVTAVYNRHRYQVEKRDALTRWASLLKDIAANSMSRLHLHRRLPWITLAEELGAYWASSSEGA